ncbi:hypothetical protein E2C01_059059 [Portunus trituberculatus]|uniref:Uncharacterized protein n=1 Tax=Portunus trituberculatus TaxID=210409 RepID=A0A5B7H6E2_PORTR|nr:hypothetical protein [Portunus trituberculatus]
MGGRAEYLGVKVARAAVAPMYSQEQSCQPSSSHQLSTTGRGSSCRCAKRIPANNFRIVMLFLATNIFDEAAPERWWGSVCLPQIQLLHGTTSSTTTTSTNSSAITTTSQSQVRQRHSSRIR